MYDYTTKLLCVNRDSSGDEVKLISVNELYASSVNGDKEKVLHLLQSGVAINGWSSSTFNTALTGASRRGNNDMVSFLLSHGADIESRNGLDETPLTAAVAGGNTETVSLLLRDHNADINAPGGCVYGEDTALIGASRRGDNVMVLFLLSEGADREKRNGDDETPLIAAASGGNTETVSVLLNHGAVGDATDGCGDTALTGASRRGDNDMVSLLLSKKADIERIHGFGETPLIAAASSGSSETVSLLLRHNADINTIGGCGWTPLIAAAARGWADTVSVLLDHGADISASDYIGEPPLIAAVSSGNTETVSLLLSHGAEINARGGRDGTALSKASRIGDNNMISFLLSHEADVESRNNIGVTSLTPEPSSENTETGSKQRMIGRGADIDAIDDSGKTPLIVAVSSGNKETVSVLLRHGADVNATDDIDTALTGASKRSDNDMVSFLLGQRADIEGRNVHGETPLIAAVSSDNTETTTLLLSHGADISATDGCGRTSLMTAASKGYHSVVDVLLLNGANKDNTDRYGKSAKDFALRKGDLICADLLTDNKLYTSWVKPLISSNPMPLDGKLLQNVKDVCRFTYTCTDVVFNKDLMLNWSNMGMHDDDLEIKLKGFSDNTQYQILLIDNNHLTFLPDLGQYPQLQALQILVIFNNKIRVMRGFPPTLKTIFLRENNIKVLEKKCFHAAIFDNLKKQLKEARINANLKRPPQEILNLGLQAVLDYFTQGDFLLNHHNRMVLTGPSMDGKSSLVASLIAGKPMLTTDDDRTQVVDIRKWEISETEVIYIFDQGGHDLYQITNPYFISPRSTVIISHKVCCSEPDNKQNISFNQEINKTMQFLRTTLHQHPENEIYIAVMKTDQLAPSEELNNSEENNYCLKVKTAVHEGVQFEIDNLNKILRKADDSFSSNISSMRDNFISRLTGIKFFPVSSSTYAGIDNFKTEIHKKIKEESTEVPKTWIDTYHVMKADKKGFWTFSQFQICFIQHSEDSNCQTCLRYFHETGLVIWNENHPHLKGYIFYDMDFLVAIFKSLLDHSLAPESFESDENVQDKFDDEEEFQEIVNLYQKEGLLKHKFLSFLLGSYDLSKENEVTIVEIIKLFHICSDIDPNCTNLEEQIYFVPWLVRDNQPPSDVNIHRPLYIDQQTLTLVMRYQFFNSIPINITEMFCVEIQKYSVENHYLCQRYAWHDGLQVFLGPVQIVLFRMAENRSLYLCVKGNPSYLSKLWKPFRDLHVAFEKLLEPWRGVVRSRHSVCAHCVLHGIDPPHHWMPKQVFPEKPFQAEARCPKSGDVIPAALITCLPLECTDVTEQVELVQTYLKNNAVATQVINCREKKLFKRAAGPCEHEDGVTTPQNYSIELEDEEFKSITEIVNPEEDFAAYAGLCATKANYKLNQQESYFVLEELLPSMCRINLPGYSGTGFTIGGLVDPVTGQTHRYVLTCYHIKLYDALRDQQHCEARFQGRDPNANPVIVKIQQPPLFWNRDMDYVLVKLESSLALDRYLAGKVSLGQLVTVNEPVHNDALVLCAYTTEPLVDWGAQAVSLDNEKAKKKHGHLPSINLRRVFSYYGSPNYVYTLSRNFTFYNCSCQEGTSGAPCFSAPQTRLFAMHCGSVFREKPIKLEYGVLIKNVVHDIKETINNPSSVAGASNMQQGGIQLNQLFQLFPNIPSNYSPDNSQVSTMAT